MLRATPAPKSMIKAGTEPIPGFRLESLLGRGQFGEVWRARSPGNTFVAMKFLQLSGTHGWKEFRAIQRVKQIRHANLMPIIAIWLLDDDGQVISDDVIETIENAIDDTGVAASAKATLIAEPISQSRRPAQMIIETPLGDQTLRQRMAECQEAGKPGIPVDELLKYLEEAAKGLGFLNTASSKIGDSRSAIQHCDVKPDNIMLMGGSAVVTDFGVAQTQTTTGSDATATSLGGTPAYMAPECFLSKTSHATDQYALAVTYYELRTGELPFTERTYAAVYEAHKSGSLNFSAVSPREQAVLRAATSVNPDKRYESCAELVRQLQEAVRPGSSATKSRWGWRAAATALVGAAAIVALVSAIPLVFPDRDALEKVTAALAGGNYVDAESGVHYLADAEQLNKALQLFLEQFEKDDKNERLSPETVETRLREIIELAGYIDDPQVKGKLEPERVARLHNRIANDLDSQLGLLRAECEEWNPLIANPEIPDALQDRRNYLSSLLNPNSEEKEPSPASSCQECIDRQPLFELQSIRIDARAGDAKLAAVQKQLAAIGRRDLGIDNPYPGILAFILGSEDAGTLTREQIEELFTLYADFSLELRGREPAPWEHRRVHDEFTKVDNAIQAKWLDDPEDRLLLSLVERIPESRWYEDVRSGRLPLQLARGDRKVGKFAEASRRLESMRNGNGEEGQPALDAALLKDIQDEEFIIDLVNPLTSPLIRTSYLSRDEGQFDYWLKIANAVHDDSDYQLSDFNPTAKGPIAPVPAALIEYLRLECLLSKPDPSTADAGVDEAELSRMRASLAETDFKDYSAYVESLRLRHAADTVEDLERRAQLLLEASNKVLAVMKPRNSDPLLSSKFRIDKARDILLEAVDVWCSIDPPTDLKFGNVGLIGGRAAATYENLVRALRLKPSSAAKHDALLLAAAVAAWSDVQPDHPPALLTISQRLLDGNQSDDAVRSLLGTIYVARAKAQQATGAGDVELLSSYARAIKAIYLEQRGESSGVGATLADDQLRRIRIDLIDEAQKCADRVAEAQVGVALAPSLAADMSVVYRAAGLIYRAQSTIDELGFDVNTDQVSYDLLKRANDLADDSAPDVEAIIEQARALLNLDFSSAEKMAELQSLAKQAVSLAETLSSQRLRGRAHSLKARALLELARDGARPLNQRVKDFEEAFAISETGETSLRAAGPAAEQDLAECLVDRGNIHVQYTFWGDLDYTAKVKALEDACNCANAATAIKNRKNGDFAYLVWGNALEDSALYLLKFTRDDGQANYDLACQKFQAAIDQFRNIPGNDAWREQTANAQESLLRCRMRWATSGTLPNEAAERELLEKALAEVAETVKLFNEVSQEQSAGARERAMHISMLLFRFNQACRELAGREDAVRKAELTAQADAALRLAVEWAAASQSTLWAKYQLELARRFGQSQDWTEAKRLVLQIREAKDKGDFPVEWSDLWDAADFASKCDANLGQIWTDADWAAWESRFPVNDLVAAPYVARFWVSKFQKKNNWDDEQNLKKIDELLTRLASQKSKVAIEAQAEWLWIKANHKLLDQKNYSEAHEDYLTAVRNLDGTLVSPLAETLNALQREPSKWSTLTAWEQRKLRTHFHETLEYRKRLGTCVLAMAGELDPSAHIPVNAADIKRRRQIVDEGRNALRFTMSQHLPPGLGVVTWDDLVTKNYSPRLTKLSEMLAPK